MKCLHIKIIVLGFIATLLLNGWGRGLTARAHAELERSEPAANAIISTAPAEVHLWFTEELFRRKGVNVIEVSRPDGTKVDQGDTRIDDDDRKHAVVSLKRGLTGGVYTVRWQSSSSEDGHEGSGEFSFTVDPTAGESNPQANPAVIQPSAASTTAPSTPTAPPSSTPASPASSGLPCLGGLLLGWVLLVTRTRPRIP